MTVSDTKPGRWLARKIIVDGIDYGLSVVSICHKDSRWEITIEKFERETHSTSYHSGCIRISTDKNPEVAPLIEFF